MMYLNPKNIDEIEYSKFLRQMKIYGFSKYDLYKSLGDIRTNYCSEIIEKIHKIHMKCNNQEINRIMYYQYELLINFLCN